MAEGDITFYNSYKVDVVAGNVDWDADTIKVMLVNTYTPNIDTHDFIDDVTGASTEISGSGYTAGGEALATKTNTEDTTNDQADVGAADVTWTSLASNTISHAIIYKDTGTPATSPLVAYMEISTNSNGANYTISWNGGDIFTLT